MWISQGKKGYVYDNEDTKNYSLNKQGIDNMGPKVEK